MVRNEGPRRPRVAPRPRHLHPETKLHMTTQIELTLACGDYEIMRPLKEGIVRPDGIDLKVVTAMDSPTRHWRFLRNREFDMAEVLVARPTRRRATTDCRSAPSRCFRIAASGTASPSSIPRKGITKPTDLIGRKVGVKFFLNSAALWLRGILQHEYGVPFTSIEWFTELDEDVDRAPPPGVKHHRVPAGTTIVDMLLAGELDAVLHPDLIEPLRDKDPRVGRLFPDYKAEETAYFKKTGIFPIMHVLGIKQEIVEQLSLGADQHVQSPSRRPRRSPWSGWRTRASSRSPGTARPGRSSRKSSGPTRGNTA